MKVATPAQLTAAVRRHAAVRTGSGLPRVVASGNFATPHDLLAAVDEGLPGYRLNVLNAHPGVPVRAGVVHETSFVGPGVRGLPSLAYVPARLSLLPTLLGSVMKPDVVLLHCSVPRQGKVSLGIEVNVLPAAVESARVSGGLVLAQLNPHMPYTFGDGELDTDLVDLAIEAAVPLPSPGGRSVDDDSAEIGRLVADRIGDRSTLQLGIGAIPDAALDGLTGRRGLRIWSEMVGDGVLRLAQAGALDAEAEVVASFMFGSDELYAWVDQNPRVRMARTERANDPAQISRQPAMTSINSALEVDLFGQANASRLNNRIHSGFGGATDFLVGALHASDGQAFVALRSWHPRADVSCVVALLDEPVTSFQPSAIVTEQGVAQLLGRTEQEQARAIIEQAAHPDVRDELAEEAHHLGLA
ncbi:acetyl-CoA hydrolase/transferase family protein [Angustibacter sp. McL0619]|uniref:acetyl-CoA hydrolase/transferase family protein n=1 Tax=Angustibacter sp. McL0619 TaxID=3415676 RepID=UPI003CF36051